ncbi:hypothetical protein BU15DRAFT_64692 [Melanogaster broomeanus]|nr:hypothetical protein BU15DRAFT_64692 [Melanogaster broomeanus]
MTPPSSSGPDTLKTGPPPRKWTCRFMSDPFISNMDSTCQQRMDCITNGPAPPQKWTHHLEYGPDVSTTVPMLRQPRVQLRQSRVQVHVHRDSPLPSPESSTSYNERSVCSRNDDHIDCSRVHVVFIKKVL